VADIGRKMGMTRQGVQRIADLLVDRGLAEYRENQAHRRAKLLACTEAGYRAIARIATVQHPWADRIGTAVGIADLNEADAVLRRLIEVLESD
jgi:DNA-binding MarR family transcriptional regulator